MHSSIGLIFFVLKKYLRVMCAGGFLRIALFALKIFGILYNNFCWYVFALALRSVTMRYCMGLSGVFDI